MSAEEISKTFNVSNTEVVIALNNVSVIFKESEEVTFFTLSNDKESVTVNESETFKLFALFKILFSDTIKLSDNKFSFINDSIISYIVKESVF